MRPAFVFDLIRQYDARKCKGRTFQASGPERSQQIAAACD